MFSVLRWSIALACMLAVCSPVVAQQTVDVASISGRVIDASGATVPGAPVSAVHARHQRHLHRGHGSGRPVSIPVLADRAV